jgi:hypothetical protein
VTCCQLERDRGDAARACNVGPAAISRLLHEPALKLNQAARVHGAARPAYATALECYRSPARKGAMKLRAAKDLATWKATRPAKT